MGPTRKEEERAADATSRRMVPQRKMTYWDSKASAGKCDFQQSNITPTRHETEKVPCDNEVSKRS
jgi:hypothetical protein